MFGPGTDLSTLELVNDDGTDLELAGSSMAVLLVFDAACTHSSDVADEWVTWMSDHPGVRQIVLSSGDPEAFARTLTNRTPRILVVNPDAPTKRSSRWILVVIAVLSAVAAAKPGPIKGIFLITDIHGCCEGPPSQAECVRNGCWLPNDCEDCPPN